MARRDFRIQTSQNRLQLPVSQLSCLVFRLPAGGHVSPILVRPVREQLEHDRVIRLLQVRAEAQLRSVSEHRRGSEVPGPHRPVMIYPDLVLHAGDRGPKLQWERSKWRPAESVNHLEAMAQWAHFWAAPARRSTCMCRRFGRHRASARRRKPGERGGNLELSTTIGDQTRFTLAYRRLRPRRGDSAPERAPAASGRGRCPKSRRPRASEGSRQDGRAAARQGQGVCTPARKAAVKTQKRK